MKTILWAITAGVITLVAAGSPALALLPFQREWEAKYVTGNEDAKFVAAAKTARCNVCHDAKSKTRKDKNDYGKATGKFLTKTDYDKLKKDAAAAKKYVLEGLEKAELERAADGQTYGEKLKAGDLPQ
jgi:hypothetical protein